ncbi:gamma-glutamyltransferase family protein [Halovivax limisalsi]|uniref:gamma-glutamyltransferase family protein n=1 Tax=Halovivax limisalsi TaxID=1453760 RepID=UPI001FFC2F4E|nr:gamma-glutamyltransferase [Halovivax limisalsi]
MGRNTGRRAVLRAGAAGVGLGAVVRGDRRAVAATGRDASTNEVAVVSQHRLATEAGLEVLEAGGTAADAAVAVAGALSVVEPWFSSALGGGTWALYYDAESGDVTSLDGVGPVGSEASVADFEDRAGEPGVHQAIVPGAWDGWMVWLDAFGALDLPAVLDPAIRLAREGYPASAAMADWLDRGADEIESRPATAAIYERDGRLVREGETVFQREMAATFESLADAYVAELDASGDHSAAFRAARDHFYRGPVAEAIVEFSDERDGYLTRGDFADFAAELVDPISIDYTGDVRVYQNPPNSQGITQLLALNTLKGFDLRAMDPVDALHVQVEAIKLAFADRHYHVGDPERVDVPVDALLSDEHAARQRERIELDAAMTWPIASELDASRGARVGGPEAADDPGVHPAVEQRGAGGAGHTSTFHVRDAAGNAAAVTTSLGAQFLVVGETGIHLNNRMRMVALEAGDPNRLAPGKKVRHTSNPYLATRDGEVWICGGNTGVDTQPQGQTQQFVHVVDFGRSAQAAIAHPRFVSSAFPSTQYPYEADNELHVEAAFPDDLVDGLEDRGHDVTTGGLFGTANMLVVGKDSMQVGAEPRTETASGVVTELEERGD